jgi:hypothetical protein
MKIRNIFLALLSAPLLVVILIGSAHAEGTPVYFMAGQAHPRFQLELSINGQVVKTVKPKPTRAKAFLKQLDEEDLRLGENLLEVTYHAVPGVADDASPTPSFIVRLYRQTDPKDKSTKEELVKLRGPGRPFTEVSDGTLSAAFQVPK